MGSIPRSVGGPSLLELDGAQVGACKSVDGGELVAEVVVEPIGQELFAKKHLGGVRYEELVLGLEVGTAGSATLKQELGRVELKNAGSPRSGGSRRPTRSSA
jgi:hypothetical protein